MEVTEQTRTHIEHTARTAHPQLEHKPLKLWLQLQLFNQSGVGLLLSLHLVGVLRAAVYKAQKVIQFERDG